MNYKQKQYWNNQLRQFMRPSNRSGSHENCFRYHRNNNEKHEDVKFLIYKKLINQGFSVWTEAILLSGHRCDLLAIKDGKGVIVEVMHSETKKKMLAKKRKYPKEFDFIAVKTKDFKIEEFEV